MSYRSQLVAFVAISLVGVVFMACSGEPANACDRSKGPIFRDFEQGIAGVSFYVSDIPQVDEMHCMYRQSGLALWRFDEVPSEEMINATLDEERPPTLEVSIDGEYAQPLDIGHYLVCGGIGTCAVLDVGAGDRWTVHTKIGIVSSGNHFRIFDPEGNDATDLSFSTWP